MEVIEKLIHYPNGGAIYLYPLGDAHLGSIHCAEADLEKKIDQIRLQKNAYIIGMGDWCDSIIKSDPRFDIEGFPNWLNKGNIIESQRKRVVEMLTPVKDKILCFLTGNHEEEQHTRYQDDITRNICSDLGITYGGFSCFLVLKLVRYAGRDRAQHRVIIHAWHGAGAAQTEGSRLMRLMRLVNDIEADIYLMGHLHSITQHTPDRLVYRNGKVKSLRLAAATTGSWLKAYTQPKEGQVLSPSYAEKKGYKPSRIGCPCIKIKPDTEEFSIES